MKEKILEQLLRKVVCWRPFSQTYFDGIRLKPNNTSVCASSKTTSEGKMDEQRTRKRFWKNVLKLSLVSSRDSTKNVRVLQSKQGISILFIFIPFHLEVCRQKQEMEKMFMNQTTILRRNSKALIKKKQQLMNTKVAYKKSAGDQYLFWK